MTAVTRVDDIGEGFCDALPCNYITVFRTGANTVFVNNKHGGAVSLTIGEADCGGPTISLTGAPTVLFENEHVHRIDDIGENCGPYVVRTGSPDVFIGSLGGAGAIIENGSTINIPGYGPATSASRFFFEHDDPDSPGSPPSGTSERSMVEEKDDQKEPPGDPPPVQDCSDADALPSTFSWTDVAGSFSAWAPTFQLSPNFTVASLTINTSFPHSFSSSPNLPSGLTQKQTIQNLCFLAKTVLEPMRSSYGNFLITSGWRSASGASQHNKGQAADCQFTSFHGSGMTGTQYFERAQNIRDTINFDQMILEWFGNNPWIHVSSNSAGHRHQVLTQTGQNSYSPGLKLLRAT